MEINLNNPSELTVENIKRLLESEDDSKPVQIRVTKNGLLYLSHDVGSENIENLAFRLETFFAGNEYVGPTAGADEDWVQTVFTVINENWPNPKASYIDTY